MHAKEIQKLKCAREVTCYEKKKRLKISKGDVGVRKKKIHFEKSWKGNNGVCGKMRREVCREILQMEKAKK